MLSAPEARLSLIGASLSDLQALVLDWGQPAFRARQLYSWLYNRNVRDLSDIRVLPKELRARLAARYTVQRPVPVRHWVSRDGTQKWLLRFPDGHEAETVYIPDDTPDNDGRGDERRGRQQDRPRSGPGRTRRGTLCVSTQIGCALACRFCHTGTQPFVRNLTSGEILAQLLLARDALAVMPPVMPHSRGDLRGGLPSAQPAVTHLVFMGMGEPLLNFASVKQAVQLLTDGDGLAISKRRITLSTAGVVSMLPRVGQEMGVLLAVSLHAVRDDLRDELVPINRKWPLAVLLETLRQDPSLSNARRVTFEYVMLDGVNDSLAEARELVRLLRGLPAKVNLIAFNPWPGTPYRCSSEARIEAFAKILWRAGYSAPVRRPRGQDIMAACGQLRSESARERSTLECSTRACSTRGCSPSSQEA